MSEEQVISPLPGIVRKLNLSVGNSFKKGQEIIVLEAMKMENAITSKQAGMLLSYHVSEGDIIDKGDPLFSFSTSVNDDRVAELDAQSTEVQSDSKIQELRTRMSYLQDDSRPKAKEKRRRKNQNTARENINRLVDSNSFVEYGGFAFAAQRSRRSVEDLIENTPADGLVCGVGHVNGDHFTSNCKCLVMAYDYTVLAGTQGTMNHMKMDRALLLARKRHLPVILFAEGGGGRPGDVDQHTIAGLYIGTFSAFAHLSNVVPTISIVSGYCFAGNAALAGSSDLIIGTKNISLGMGGPAMIEGGGLGKFHPKEVGPADIHQKNGVVDVLVENEDEAIEITKKILSYWQGPISNWLCEDQEALQAFVPDNRKRSFDIRELMRLLFDSESLIELRPEYGKGMITAFGRIEGIPLGILANDPAYKAGAITAENAKKATDFIDLCAKYQLPMVSLVDTPGIMVGPEAEQEGTVRAAGRLFMAAARFNEPFAGVVLRRAYGLGAMAMVKGGFHDADMTVSWPTGEFGAMGLEGAVKLGFRKELEAIPDLEKREEAYNEMVEEAYERGKALSMASMFEIDNVIEPKETRNYILSIIRKL